MKRQVVDLLEQLVHNTDPDGTVVWHTPRDLPVVHNYLKIVLRHVQKLKDTEQPRSHDGE